MEKILQILIVEDIDHMQRLLEHVLSGLELTVGASGERRKVKISGLAKNSIEARLELTRRRPDLVLLDEVLPGESSLDLLRDLHADGLPTLLLTSLRDPSHDVPPEAEGRLIKPGWKSIEEDRARFRGEIERVLAAPAP